MQNEWSRVWVACVIGGVGKSDKVITGGASKALPERCKQKNPPFKKQRIPHIFTYSENTHAPLYRRQAPGGKL